MTTKPDQDNLPERYSRQLKIAGWDQTKLANSKVFIIGVGALGTIISVNLAQAGVGHLVLIDLDTIEFSNLNRQVLFHEKDVGRFKAEVAKEKLQEINSEITIDFYVKKVQEIPVTVFTKDRKNQKIILIDALDNFEARRWLNSIAINKAIILVSGGMFGFLGNIQVINKDELPCLECQPLIPEKELQKACSPPGEFRKSEDVPVLEKNDDFFPALGSAAAVVGGLMAQEALKILLDLEYLKEYLFIDLSKPVFMSIPLNKKDDCIVCSQKYKLKGIPFSIDNSDSLDSILTRIGLLLNISKKTITLIHNLRTIQPDSFSITDLFSTGTESTVYVSSIDLTGPFKLNLTISNLH